VNIVDLVKTGALACIVAGMAARLVLADPVRLAQATPAGAMPPSEIVQIVRSAGLLPTSEPALAGSTYVVRAVDPYGTPIRVIIDARYGYILSVHRMAATEPPHPPYGALGMRDRPYKTDYARDDLNGPVPPRAIPLRAPPAPLSAAPLRPPLPKPRAATAAESAKPVPPPEGAPAGPASSPTAAASSKQATKQESFPPVTPLQ
jgi:hypothetical protein